MGLIGLMGLMGLIGLIGLMRLTDDRCDDTECRAYTLGTAYFDFAAGIVHNLFY